MGFVGEIKQLLEAEWFKRVSFWQGASASEMEAAERELGVRFPQGYTDFLLHLGWIDCPYITVCGLGSDADWRTDLMAIVKSQWCEVGWMRTFDFLEVFFPSLMTARETSMSPASTIQERATISEGSSTIMTGIGSGSCFMMAQPTATTPPLPSRSHRTGRFTSPIAPPTP